MRLIDTHYNGELNLSTRLVMPPMATEGTETGEVTDKMVAYYEKMAQNPLFGLFIVEHAYVELQGKASPKQASIASDDVVESHKKLVSAVKNKRPDGVLLLQISHAGIKTRYDFAGFDPLAPSKKPWDKSSHVMTEEDCRRVKEAFVQGALRAKEAGYDGVEIHSAHGYLLNQFLSPLTNFREDDYGKDRLKYPLEVFAAVKDAVGDFPVAVRIGGFDDMEGGTTIQEGIEAARRFQEAGVCLLDMTGGMTGFLLKDSKEPGWFKDLSRGVKEFATVPVMLTGGVTTVEEAEALLEENVADLIGVGRAFLKDPDWGKQ